MLSLVVWVVAVAQGILLWLQRCVFGTAVCVDPCEELVLRNNDPAADFERGEAVASCQLISTGTRDAEHRSDLGDGEHQRQFVVACVGGVFHCVRPFLMLQAADPLRTACAELAAVLLHIRPQKAGAYEKFLWLHGSAGWCSAGCRSS